MRRALVVGLGAATSACAPLTTDVPITVVLPAETSDLQRANNASLVLEPDGRVDTFAVEGLDFALSIELDPDDDERTMSLFLAEDQRLLAWGITPPFTLLGAESGLALLVARPGALSSMPTQFDAPDPTAITAAFAARAAAIVASDGSTVVLDAYTYQVAAADPLTDPPAPTDGVLAPDPEGGAQRWSAETGLRATRLEPLTGTWSERDLGTHDVPARPGATWLVDEVGARVLLVGGGDALDTVQADLDPQVAAPVTRHPEWSLDLARPDPGVATLTVDETAATVVFGSDDAALPVAWWLEGQRALGPAARWSGARCVAAAIRGSILCGGGMRDDAPTGDVVELAVAGGDVTATELPGLLSAMREPLWLVDDVAVYAQGDGRMWRIAADGSTTEVVAASTRATGGSVTRLPTGFSLLVGGREGDDTALPRWWVFAPDPVTSAD